MGTLCILDWVPRALEPRQIAVLQLLAGQVVERPSSGGVALTLSLPR